MKELQVGDVVYLDSPYHGLSKATITRVTKTRAFAGDSSFQRKYCDTGFITEYPMATGWDRASFWIETEELKIKHELQKRVSFLSNVKWGEHSIEIMTKVMELLGE